MVIVSKPILPPSAARIAREVGPVAQELYDSEGLICYREEITVGKDIMVREGYIKRIELPTGKVLISKVPTKVITRVEAEENE